MSLPSPRDQVCAKKRLGQQQHAVPPSVRVVGAINGRWFSFSGFGFGGKNSVARQATQSAFRQLKGKGAAPLIHMTSALEGDGVTGK